MDMTEDGIHLLPTEDTGRAFFLLGFQDLENVPFLADNMLIEKTDTTLTDFHGVRGPVAVIFSVKKIIPEFIFGNLIRFLAEILDQHPKSQGLS